MINNAKSCAFTGHRAVKDDFDLEKLKSIIIKLIGIGYDTFLVGMAVGFDTIAFQVLEEVRKGHNIKIIACIPCIEQSARFSFAQKKEYDRMLTSADEKVLVNENYTRSCMQKRNEFMVDNSSCLISYVRKDKGGSVNTVKYAVKKGVNVISV